MGYKLYVGGARGTRTVCGAEFLQFGGQTISYAITDGNYALVIDAGSGLSVLKDVLSTCTKVDVLLTHLHYDHVIGFLDFDVFPKGVVPCLHGSFAEWGIDEEKNKFVRKPFWPVPMPRQTLKQIVQGTRYAFGEHAPVIPALDEDPSYTYPDVLPGGSAPNWIYATFFPSSHPDFCSCIQVEVGDKSILFLCDYEHGTPLLQGLQRPYDIMFYDATYTEEEYLSHRGYGHSTVKEGAKLARQLGVKRMVFTHHEPSRTDEELYAMEKQAQALLENSMFARSKMIFEL